MRLKRVLILFTALLAALCLSSCDTMAVEDFYTLPQLSNTYLQLQQKIDELLDSGAEYAAPTSGSNRQAVQLQDIDGDGVNEAIVFLRVAGSTRPLKIVIFRNDGSTYTELARIEGEGSGIDSISYIDMDGSGEKEIAVGWTIASGMNMLSVYTMRDFNASDILSTDYTHFITYDIDSDGKSNVIVFRLSSSSSVADAEVYALQDDGELTSETVRLSTGAEALRRVRTGTLADGRPSVLVESDINGGTGLVTDILSIRGGKLVNITMDDETGVSTTTRSSQVFCRDINADDVLDVPRLEPMPQLTESTYYMIHWYNYLVNGRTRLVCTTYNNNSDSWYLILPDEWVGNVTVRRQDGLTGERAVVFSYVGDGVENAVDFLVVYTLTGDNREERAHSAGRFILRRDDEKIYAAAVLSAKVPITVDEDTVRANFNILYSEWYQGATS